MRFPNLSFVVAAAVLIAADLHAAGSDWAQAPQPKFPSTSLQKGSEGTVKLRLSIAKDGTVTNGIVVKTSGDRALDEAARNAVLKWKMKPSAIKPSDLAKGRVEEIEFRPEALMAATYRGGVVAGFTGEGRWRQWIYAPFPYYPMDARRLHHTGMVVVSATIGRDGQVVGVRVIKSSGYNDLDELAANAIRHWRAHKQHVGQNLVVPVNFKLGHH